MARPRTISLDAMGGDGGPGVVVPGAALALGQHPDVEFLFFGDRARVEGELAAHAALARTSRIVHTDITVAMQDKPSQAVRRRGSSMWLALEAVHKGEADCMVSAGNTGALMAMAKLCLRTMPGIERPAIAGLWPTISKPCIVLDLGANIGATARQLGDYALMGAAMARALFNVERPSVGLLNIGVEEIKGIEEVRQAHAWLKQSELPIDYRGFIEGDQIGQRIADVVVVEGFAGNMALKTAEGTAKQMAAYVREALTSSWAARIGALFAARGLSALKDRMDPRRLNGGPLLGLNGIAIKSHGGTDAFGYASAINVGYQMVESNVLERLAADLDAFHGTLHEAEAARKTS
ncbi:MAG TPA: phosphate acyltransferase PlsX [Hyphomicrobiaceae bacterium]|jgi:glycerol-3-phosphate acyltransferase PlsX|nr:phosphate acyltransferase PlsX [Hyphomicrobiaceae bacterium]